VCKLNVYFSFHLSKQKKNFIFQRLTYNFDHPTIKDTIII